MDNFVNNILEEWGLNSLIPIFKEEEFNQEAFESLDYQGVSNLIKKQGLRAIFWAKFVKKYKTIQLSTTEALSENIYTSDVIENDSVTLSDITSVSTSCNRQQLPTQEFVFFEDTSATSLPVLDISCSEICGNIVRNFLKCTEGMIVETFYEKNSRKLDAQHRNILAKVIIYKEYEYQSFPEKFKITTQRFVKYLDDIVEIFPSEEPVKCLYFTPYDKTTHKNAQGKLWDHYNHLKQKLSKNQKSNISVCTPNNEVEPSILDKIEFLKKNLEPFNKILELWNDTKCYRCTILENCNSIYNYYETFPILKSDKGSILLCEDFDRTYIANANKFYSNWPLIEQKIIQLASKKQKNNSEVTTLLSGDCEFKGLLLLANFLSSSVYAKGANNKRKKLTKKEVLNSFLFLQENGTLVLETIKKTFKEEAIRDKKTLQPRIILIGKSYDKIEKAQILVDDTLYTFEDTLKAVDCCFKIYNSLNCCYPEETKPIWSFLQIHVYGISTKYDQNFNSVTSLFAEISGLEKN